MRIPAKNSILVAVLIVGMMGLGASAADDAGADVFSRAGLDRVEVEETFLSVLTGSEPPVYLFHKVKQAVPADEQARWLQDAFVWARSYAAGPDFASRYAAWREEHRPKEREKLQGAEAEMQAQDAEYRRQVAEMRENMKGMTPEMRRQMEEALKQMEAARAAMADDKQMMAAMEQGIRMQNEENQQRFKQELVRFEQNFPADHRPLLRRRLEEFVAVCDTVDFAARLQEKDGLMRFVDPDLEAQTVCWKLIFRAGQERAREVRALALAWLQALNQ